MNPTELEQIQAQLHDQIRRTAIDLPSENTSNLILDGISDISAYCASAPKNYVDTKKKHMEKEQTGMSGTVTNL